MSIFLQELLEIYSSKNEINLVSKIRFINGSLLVVLCAVKGITKTVAVLQICGKFEHNKINIA